MKINDKKSVLVAPILSLLHTFEPKYFSNSIAEAKK